MIIILLEKYTIKKHFKLILEKIEKLKKIFLGIFVITKTSMMIDKFKSKNNLSS